MPVLQLSVVSQEKKLLDVEVHSVTAPTSTGEVTILPNHIPLFTELTTGELIYRVGETQDSFVISRGFLSKSPQNELTIMVDTATSVRDISLEKAQEAVKQAQETMHTTTDKRELILAEASLKKAMLEVNIAMKSKKSRI